MSVQRQLSLADSLTPTKPYRALPRCLGRRGRAQTRLARQIRPMHRDRDLGKTGMWNISLVTRPLYVKAASQRHTNSQTAQRGSIMPSAMPSATRCPTNHPTNQALLMICWAPSDLLACAITSQACGTHASGKALNRDTACCSISRYLLVSMCNAW